MIFSPIVTINTTPAISVTIADSGVPSLTYAQLKNSLGNQVYKANSLYIYSTSISQLIGVIKYSIYNSDGNQDVTNIATTVDPNQYATSINVDLLSYKTPIVFNGNSSISTNIFANTYVQIKLRCIRITNKLGNILSNYIQIEKDANKPHFFDNYGNRIEIEQTDKEISETAVIKDNNSAPAIKDTVTDNRKNISVLIYVAIVSAAIYVISKSKK